MNFLKKKKNKKTEEQKQVTPLTLSLISVEDLPTGSLELAYNEIMSRYEETRESKLQGQLVTISKILTDRAATYQQGQGNGSYEEKDALETLPFLTKEKYRSLSSNEKENVEKMVKQAKKLKTAMEDLTTPPEPEKIEVNVNVTEPTTQDLEIERMEQEREKEIEYEQIRKEVEKKVRAEMQKEEVTIIDDVEVNEESLKNNNVPKKKIDISGFFKKKVPKTKPNIEPIGVGSQLDTKITTEQKQRAIKMEQATIKKHDNPLKKVFMKSDKPKEKNLPDLFCTDCTHPLKAHQSKGVSVGCKCGCLNTIERIAEKHGVQLYSPKDVLNRIEVENIQQIPEPTQQIPDTQQIPESTQVIKQLVPDVEPDVILKQAKALESIIPKSPKTGKPIIPNANLTKPSLCANCDHNPNDHFESNSFCTVIGCICENYRSYPE